MMNSNRDIRGNLQLILRVTAFNLFMFGLFCVAMGLDVAVLVFLLAALTAFAVSDFIGFVNGQKAGDGGAGAAAPKPGINLSFNLPLHCWPKPTLDELTESVDVEKALAELGEDESLPPVLATRDNIKRDLLDNMRKILGCGVTIKALNKPSEMTFDDILCNLHLYERLGIAFVALGALNGYKGVPRGYIVREQEVAESPAPTEPPPPVNQTSPQ